MSLSPGLGLCAHSYPGKEACPGASFTVGTQSILGRAAFASLVGVSPTFARCCGPFELGLNRCSP